MSEEPKNIWKKSFTGRTALVVWLAVVVFTVMLGGIIVGLLNWNRSVFEMPLAVAVLVGGLLAACFVLTCIVWPLARWLIRKHWRRTLFGFACLVTLIALFYAEEDWRGKHDWEKYKHAEEAKGEKFDFKDFVPPSVPDDQNFAMVPIWVESMKAVLGPVNAVRMFGDHYTENGRTNFVNQLDMETYHPSVNSYIIKITSPKIGNWQEEELTDLRAWQNYYRLPSYTNQPELKSPVRESFSNGFPGTAQPQSPAQDVLLALSKYDPAIEALRQASQRPYSRFPLNYDAENTGAILLPHLATLKKCAQVLQLRAIAELQNGQSEKAMADVTLSMRLIDSVRTEPFLVSLFVRMVMTEITLQPIYEGLAAHQWTDEQLVTLDAELAKLDFLSDYQLSLRVGRAMTCGLIDSISKMNTYHRYQMVFGIQWNSEDTAPSDQFEKSAKAIGIFLMPTGWLDQNKLFIAQGVWDWSTVSTSVRHLASPQKYREVVEAQARIYSTSFRPWNFLAKKLFPALDAAGRKACREQISADLARTAIALERYRLARGEYPESLDALAPQFIAQVPHDVIGGGPLHYRRTSDGQFVLYSIGWNEQDDGGVVVFKKGSSPDVDLDKGDWVWRYPAK